MMDSGDKKWLSGARMLFWCKFHQLKRPRKQFSKYLRFHKFFHIKNRPLMINFYL